MINLRLDKMVDSQFKHRKWKLGELAIQNGTVTVIDGTKLKMQLVKMGCTNQTVPIARCSPPSGVIGFHAFYIWHVDVELLEFLQFMQHTIKKDVTLTLKIRENDFRCWVLMSQRIWPLSSCSVTKINRLKANNFTLRHHVSRNVLFECTNLRTIIELKILPEQPPHVEALLNPPDHLNETIEQNLFRWLHTPRSEGHPKFFISPNAIPVNYLISCTGVPRGMQLFDLHNQHTKERLTCSLFCGNVLGAHIGSTKAVVVRRPVSVNDDHTFHALENDANKMIESLLYINFKESDIGPRLLAELGPISIPVVSQIKRRIV